MKLLLEQELEALIRARFQELLEKEVVWFSNLTELIKFVVEDFEMVWSCEFYSHEVDSPAYLQLSNGRELELYHSTTYFLKEFPEEEKNFLEQLKSRMKNIFLEKYKE